MRGEHAIGQEVSDPSVTDTSAGPSPALARERGPARAPRAIVSLPPSRAADLLMKAA
jgi:hypothetical protein